MKGKSRCTISTHVAAPCNGCGRPADPCHIVSAIAPAIEIKFCCEQCCPEHGTPLLQAGATA